MLLTPLVRVHCAFAGRSQAAVHRLRSRTSASADRRHPIATTAEWNQRAPPRTPVLAGIAASHEHRQVDRVAAQSAAWTWRHCRRGTAGLRRRCLERCWSPPAPAQPIVVPVPPRRLPPPPPAQPAAPDQPAGLRPRPPAPPAAARRSRRQGSVPRSSEAITPPPAIRVGGGPHS